MSKRYIQIDSNYRNRELWTNQSQFNLNVNIGYRDSIYALDPVSDNAPIKIWTDISNCKFIIDSSYNDTTHYKDTFFVDFSNNSLHKDDIDIKDTFEYPNYFKGLPIDISGGNKTYIKESIYTGKDSRYIIKIGDSITDEVSGTEISIGKICNDDRTNFWVPYSMYSDNIYNENYYLLNDSSGNNTSITNYDNKTSTISIDLSGGNDFTNIGKLSIRKSPSIIHVDICGNTPVNNGELYLETTNILTHDSSGNTSNPKYTNDDYLANSFLRDNNRGNIYKISNWKKEINKGVWTKKTKGSIIKVNGTTTDISGGKYELLKFSRDNEIPLMVNGNTTERQNLTCYEISLLSLSLPNVILKNNYKVVNFPYFSVGLSNMSNYQSIDNGVIYSNNPNIKKALFRATIHDTDNFEKSDFIKINGDGMTQTLKFKPNNNLKFSVYLPNGELFQTRLKDNKSPSEPNQSIQISALFEIKKL